MKFTDRLRRVSPAVLGTAMLGFSMNPVLAEDITVTSFGGIWETAIKDCFANE